MVAKANDADNDYMADEVIGANKAYLARKAKNPTIHQVDNAKGQMVTNDPTISQS